MCGVIAAVFTPEIALRVGQFKGTEGATVSTFLGAF
jgi:hypothetical protein